MIRKIFRVIFLAIGVALGFGLYHVVRPIIENNLPQTELSGMITMGLFMLLFGLIFFLLFPLFLKAGQRVSDLVSTEFSAVPTKDLVIGGGGLLIGLIVAFLLGAAISDIPYVGIPLTILLYFLLGYIGMMVAWRKKDDITPKLGPWFLSGKAKHASQVQPSNQKGESSTKILDTSVIIDGRIADIARIGFLEGKIIVPNFVLEELRHIADSSDDLKRTKGRRGLDILNMMQTELQLDFEIVNKKYPEGTEVDVQLLMMAEEMKAYVVTNDYNLNKVAKFQKVKVLNINELANAIKPVHIPGEEMEVTVVKEGKEHNQGVAYLDDGTMIVVENGRHLIGETIKVDVTSVLQTAAGRMIFAKPE